MYRVKYYLSGGTLVRKYFPNLSEAIMFSVYNVGFEQMHTIDLIKE